MDSMAMMQQNENAAIPELEESESTPDYNEGAGSGQRDKEAERSCGICFDPASSPVRTLCCAHLFCADHIAQWLLGPAADGRCPACRTSCSFAFGADDTLVAKGQGLLALSHPALLPLHVPCTPPPSRSPSPSPSRSSDSDSSYSESPARSYASYPTSPLSSSVDPTSSSEEEEEEDSTDYSLPALLRARALQTRRHTSHPFSSVLGARAATVRMLCIAAWVVVVAVLAGGGRWA
ncbi:hypothetical protein C8R44DRAFT_849392 [Mycena epipterygia]|nr:hypothetical protein C8R44DRAFT_849392 [Mycena epipterygia]